MNRYKTKPQEVEAVQYNRGNRAELLELAGDKVSWDPSGFAYLLAGPDNGAQRWVRLPEDFWVVRYPSDTRDYWPLTPLDFETNYEPMQGAEQGEPEPQPEPQSEQEQCPRCRAAITQYKRWSTAEDGLCEDCSPYEPVNQSNEDEVLGKETPSEPSEPLPSDWREGYL